MSTKLQVINEVYLIIFFAQLNVKYVNFVP